MLSLRNVHVHIGKLHILQGVTLDVKEGECAALLGRNGVGKTTTLRTITGVLKPRAGRIEFAGSDITHLSPDRINRLGLSTVPEGRRIFPNLTVQENLLIAARPGGWTLSAAYQLFPKLRLRAGAKGEHLSGGERQMLAIARALMAPTRLILLDEPFEGLAPAVVAEVLAAVAELRQHCSILIVEHKLETILQLANRVYVMVNGQVAFDGDTESLRCNEELQRRLLGVGASGAATETLVG
jgi:ABC-type branched-subunit amino acid transport system ATPase component